MGVSSIKQKFLVTNIALLGGPAPGTTSPGASREQQGATLTATPIPLDPSLPSPAGLQSVQIPFLGQDARTFFCVGDEVEFTVTKPAIDA